MYKHASCDRSDIGHDSHTLLLALVPVPLVDLTLSELEALRDAADEVAGPVGVLQELVLQDLQLLLVFPLPPLDVSSAHTEVVLGLLQELGNALVQIVELQFVVGDVEPALARDRAILQEGRGLGALVGVGRVLLGVVAVLGGVMVLFARCHVDG